MQKPCTRAVAVLVAASSLILLSACVAAPDDTAQLSAEKPLDQRSEQGFVDATVALDEAALARGPNDFLVTLHAAAGAASPVLTSVEATMAAHGHHASTSDIESDGSAFRVQDLDLFMSGRWQVVLGVELDAHSDVVEFALDIP